MSVTNPTTAPIPLRPLNRTRRRSSSLSAIYSSPEVDQGNGQFSSHNRSDRKTTKRSRVNHNPPSPLKQSQHAFPSVAFPLQETEWNCSSPFALSHHSNSLASSSTSFGFQSPIPSSTFTSSPFDFALPSNSSRPTTIERLPRNRTTSFPSNSTHPHPFSTSSASSGSPPNFTSNIASTATYDTNFTDSSFSSFNSSSGPPSPPSAATSPPSPPNFTFLSSRTPSLDTSATSNEGEEETMKCDKSPDEIEAERLHHVAFEQLRKTTREDEEGFVDRMRRWEFEHALEAGTMDDSTQPSNEDEEDVQADDEEDEFEFQVEVNVVPPSSFETGGKSWQRTNAVTELDFDDLARRMKSGACELEDYGLVREMQAKAAR